MRLGYDVRPFLREETGVGVYLRNLLGALAQTDGDNEYFLFSASFKQRFPREKIPAFERMTFRDLRLPVRAVNFFWNKLGWPGLDGLFKVKLDIVHSATPLILPTGGKKVVTVHDLYFCDHPDQANPEARRYLKKQIGLSLGRADGVVAISSATRNDLLERFEIPEEKVRLIYHGIDPLFLQDSPPEEQELARKKYSLPSTFILFVGALEPRKNLHGLLSALKIVHQRLDTIPLVVAGPQPPGAESLRHQIVAGGLEPWVRFLGHVPGRLLRSLYHQASVLVFPSHWEGFGLPLLEAMASGLAVAAAGVSSLPEIGGEAALYFDPKRSEEMAQAVIRLLSDNELRRALIARGKKRVLGFSWAKTAAETLEFYRSLLGG